MHPEPDELAALAADGREPDAAMTTHLRACDDCRFEYEAFQAAAAQVRASEANLDLDLERPSSSVWAGIHRELSLDDRLASDPIASDETPRSVAPIRAADRGVSRRGGWRWWPAVAAAAVVIGVLAGIAIGTRLPPSSPNESIVAEARLDPFPGWTAEGRAVIQESSDGRRTIVVELDGDAETGQLREVWLLREDATGLVSLGLLDDTTGTFALPPGIDLGEFPVVDVSSEPSDGDPAHSGDSIVRGQLRGV
ncbi:anti-sigma factor domain-containing protein [Agromyces humatus]|uniref:Anti-sigma K factor RskA C-terminal domain-containing protein n=1 Tax=Agromyces humatus TaxID=279573 RepID=A0ABP4X0Z4_9MICO|nr:anti-sigma factor [Agromyces humatus]